MKDLQIKLADDFSIKAIDYAIAGNALLGIKDTGKTYTATKIAEQLSACNIPFVAFDPIGRWKYLRMGKDGGKGIPVVVIGRQDADILLDENSIENVVRAAMQENVSIILDLYSVLNKSMWRRIVEKAVLVLLMENEPYGMRHIFIEESTEVAPQRLSKSHYDVYSAIESMGRMGGNVSLGYTLIAQRAEDINKALLEICERLILHAQNGRNSLKNIEDWLVRTRVDGKLVEKIMKSLPELESGKSWICAKREHEPRLIKIAEKETVHYNRRKPTVYNQAAAPDIASWIEKIKSSLAEQAKEPKIEIKQKARGKLLLPTIPKENESIAAPATAESSQIILLQNQVDSLNGQLANERKLRQQAESRLQKIREHLQPQYDSLQFLFSESTISQNGAVDKSFWEGWRSKVGSAVGLLDLLIEKNSVSKEQAKLWLKLSRESVRTYANVLIRAGLIKKDGAGFMLVKPE